MSDHFPEEVIVEILERLPVKSLLKCRLVCKDWFRLITHPSFISTHLQTSLSNPNSHFFLLKLFKNNEENYFLYCDNDDFDEFKQLHFPVKDCWLYFDVIGSCNGLICIRCIFQDIDSVDFVLWNPSIRKHITFPQPCISCSTDTLKFGFGFDSTTNDYKILVVSGETGEAFSQAYLFSLNGNSWKKVTAISPRYAIDYIPHPFIFVNGVVHCLGYQRGKDGGFENTILGFDMGTEEFLEINLPKPLTGLCPLDLSIMKYEESSIAVLKRDWADQEQLDIWVMKDYGAVGSWTKVLHLTDQSGKLPGVLGFRQNGEVLLDVDDREIASLDLNCREIEYFGIEGGEGFSTVYSYVESLVLLDKGEDAGCVNDVHHASDSSDSDAS